MIKISKEMETVISFSGKVDSSLVAAAAKASKEMAEYTREVAKANDISMRDARAAIKQAKEVTAAREAAATAAKQIEIKQAQDELRIAQKAAAEAKQLAEKQAQDELRIAQKAAAGHKAVLNQRASHVKSFFKGIGKLSATALKAVGVGALAAATAATMAIGSFAKKGIEVASSLEEVQNVVSTTFGANEKAINDFAQSTLNSFGVSELSAKKYSSTLGSMFKSMNVGEKDMLSMSTNLSALAGDMASFHDLGSTDEAFEKLRSGISGETEPLKALGINMTVDNLEDFAKAQGETTKFADMTQAQQAAIRYGFIMDATADAQGDFLRTSDGYANQQRLLGENYKQLSGQVMQGILPALASILKVLNTFMAELDTQVLTDFMNTIADMITANMPLIQEVLPQIVKLITDFIPIVVDLMNSFIPLITDIMPQVFDLVTLLMPVFSQVVEVLMPVLSILLTEFMEAVAPLIPIVTELLELLSPVLNFIAKIVGFLMKLASSFIGAFLQNLVDQLKRFGDVINTVLGFFNIGKNKDKDAKDASAAQTEMAKYASGGFASVPSIFGEAGLEAAIPIRPGNSQSIGLLYQTASMLGVKKNGGEISPLSKIAAAVAGSNTNSYQFTYAPTFPGGNKEEIEPLLKKNASEVKKVFEDLKEDLERRHF